MFKIISTRGGKYEVEDKRGTQKFSDAYNAQQYVNISCGVNSLQPNVGGVVIRKNGDVITYDVLCKDVVVKDIFVGDGSGNEEAFFYVNLMRGRGWVVKIFTPAFDENDCLPPEEVSYGVLAAMAEDARRVREGKERLEKEEREARAKAAKASAPLRASTWDHAKEAVKVASGSSGVAVRITMEKAEHMDAALVIIDELLSRKLYAKSASSKTTAFLVKERRLNSSYFPMTFSLTNESTITLAWGGMEETTEERAWRNVRDREDFDEIL